jgi:L-ascorbate peroxidase
MIASILLSRASFFHSIAAPMITCIIPGTHLQNAPQASLPLPSTDERNEEIKPAASKLVRDSTSMYLGKEPSMAGPLLRLAFHDAATQEQYGEFFTGGPNASIRYELDWSENRGLSKPLDVVNTMYNDIGIDMGLSFADCIALASVEALEFAGGPKIKIRLGRRDATQADDKKRRNVLRGETERSVVDTTLPSAALDSDGLRLYFGSLRLS